MLVAKPPNKPERKPINVILIISQTGEKRPPPSAAEIINIFREKGSPSSGCGSSLHLLGFWTDVSL